MPPYTGTQRHYISQFVGFTQAKDAVAAKYLRANGWNVEQAVDAYFSSSQAAAASSSTPALNKIFDEYRDDPKENPDTIGIEGAMKFLEAIEVRLDEVACLGIAELLKSPSMGEFTRTGFVDGWKSVGVESIPQMISHAASLRTRISSQPDTFRKVYRYAFPLCRMQGQRNLTFEIAAEQWQLFFTSENGGVDWQTPSTPWLDWYLEYLKSKGQRPVNKDLWEQTEVFMRKTLEDENFGWWDADGAWPGTLDEFVEFVKQDKRGGKPAGAMNTE